MCTRSAPGFVRNLRDYADKLEQAQNEHWIRMGILAAPTVVNVRSSAPTRRPTCARASGSIRLRDASTPPSAAGVLNSGASGKLFATDDQYANGNIAQSNLAVCATGENVAGYWKAPQEYPSPFIYVGRVDPVELWDGGGHEFTRGGPIPSGDLGPFHPIPWAAGT